MMSSGYGYVVRVSGNEMGAHVEVSARNPLQHIPIHKDGQAIVQVVPRSVQVMIIHDTL